VSRVTGSVILAGSGRVTGRCDRPAVSDPVFVVFFVRALLLIFGREYATLECVGFCVLSCFHVLFS